MPRPSKQNKRQKKEEEEDSSTISNSVAAAAASAPSLRRSTRRRNITPQTNTRVSYAELSSGESQSDNADDDDDDDEEETENKDVEDVDVDDSEEQDDNNSDESEDQDDNNNDTDNEKSNLSCPRCQKTFKAPQGLEYHVKNKVCTSGRKKGRRKTSNTMNTSKSQYKKIRGKLKDRTCPNCHRVFTSVTGLNYHTSNKVCAATPQSEKSTTLKSWATLSPGSQFVTPYGVVQVIHDTRAIPTANVPEDLKAKLKRYYSAISKRDSMARKLHSNYAVLSRARRTILSERYHNQQISAQTVAQAYQEIYQAAQQRRWEAVSVSNNNSSTLQDPNYPEGSFPDRIVECFWIPDRRPRFLGADESEPIPWNPDGATTTMKLYLQRRMLSQGYSETSSLHYCPSCGKCFGSKPGCKYHVENCRKKSEKSKIEMQTKIQSINERSNQLLARISFQSSTHSSKIQRSQKSSAAAKIPKRKYVEVEREVDNANSNATTASKASIPSEVLSTQNIQSENEEKEATEEKAVEQEPEHPDDTLAKMEADLYKYQCMLLGPVYPAVWHSLGFKKPKLSRRKRKPADEKSKRQRIKTRETSEKVQPPQPLPGPQTEFPSAASGVAPSFDFSAMPPVIDTRVFVAEVEAGRYPSIKRYSGPHDRGCAICKQTESPSLPGQVQVLPCDFCKQSVHFACIRTKWTVKDPEPEDDFMCHNCIQVVIARRNRAEKRRLEKLAESDALSSLEEVTNNPDPVEMLTDVVPGQEFECAAAQARRLEELTELLNDAKNRLANHLHVASMDQTRVALLRAVEEVD